MKDIAPEEDPFDPDYEAFLTEVAKTCKAKHRPCGGCEAGGICDGADEPEDDGHEDHYWDFDSEEEE